MTQSSGEKLLMCAYISFSWINSDYSAWALSTYSALEKVVFRSHLPLELKQERVCLLSGNKIQN